MSEELKEKAVEKLKKELSSVKQKYAKNIIEQLIKRCEDDNGIAEDVLQEHKTWDRCYSYITGQAKKQARGGCAMVEDSIVYEWAEDYYHKDDKAEAEKEKKAAEEKAKAKSAAKKNESECKKGKKTEGKAPEKAKSENKPASKPKKLKEVKENDGQLSLFDMM